MSAPRDLSPARIDALMKDVCFVAKVLDALELCQFPDEQCFEPNVDGTGYCPTHLDVMRIRAIAEMDAPEPVEFCEFQDEQSDDATGTPRAA